MIYKYIIGRYMICTYIRYVQYILFIHAFITGKIQKKIKKHLRNLEAENSPKFKKHPGWPKNLVSYKKKMCIVFSSTAGGRGTAYEPGI